MFILKFFYSFACLSESNGGWRSTPNSFIFSLRNKEGLAPFKSMVTNPSKAIYRSSSYGPIFGWSDIRIANNATSNINSYTNFGHSYSVPSGVKYRGIILAGTYKFTPDDWEMFYLTTETPTKGAKLNYNLSELHLLLVITRKFTIKNLEQW